MNASSAPQSELPAIGFLAEVSPEHRSFLSCFGKFLRPESGEVLIEEGASQDSLYIVLAGTLHVVSSTSERPMLLAVFGEGESIGEVNLFDPAAAVATVVARTEGLLWSLNREELDGFLAADPAAGVSVLRGLLKQTAKRIRNMNEKLLTAEQRSQFHNFWTSGAK